MSTDVLPITIDRSALRALYDEAIAEINTLRNTDLYTTNFYARTGDAVFDAGCLALEDATTDTRRMHTVSAPAGGGKTTFSYALIAAVTRCAENRPDAPYGSVIVVERIDRAEEVYQELSALLPGKVWVWTTDHDCNCKEFEKLTTEPTVRSTRAELQHFPVIVVTHNFYLRAKGHFARTVVRNGVVGKRALTVIDERPDEAPELEIELEEAQHARVKLTELHPETKVHMDALLCFMERYSYEPANKLYRPGIEVPYDVLAKELSWFRTDAAKQLARSVSFSIPGIDKVFAFAKALVIGRACVATDGLRPYFFGYGEQRVVDLTAGAILLDATADIDGISSIVPWRVETETPKARYDNLEVTHVPQHTTKHLKKYLEDAVNQRAYVKWMVDTIEQHMKPGEKGLVICKKSLFKAARIPTWNERDPRFKNPKIYAEDYGWDIGGRHLCAAHWGTGVGSNAWKEADVVFLFDEYVIPRRAAVARTQGLRGHRVDQGDLGSMSTLNSKARGVDSIAVGDALRWTKQLALRGRARTYDENGVCGK